MIRVLWGVVQLIAVAVAAVWIFNRPGTVSVHWLGYDIQTNAGVAFLALVTLMIFVFSKRVPVTFTF